MEGKTSEPINPAAFDIKGAAAYTGLGTSLIAELVARNEIPSLKIKGRRLFRRAALDSWLEGLEAEQQAA